MRVHISDEAEEILIETECDDPYNPDVLHDLANEASALYMRTLVSRQSLAAVVFEEDGDDDE